MDNVLELALTATSYQPAVFARSILTVQDAIILGSLANAKYEMQEAIRKYEEYLQSLIF